LPKLIYSTIASLDGYVADQNGNFDWGAPDEEVHTFVNNLERRVGTYLYGRRMYEVLAVWERPEAFDDPSPVILDYAQIWQGADKVVYSRTLSSTSTARTRIERDFDLAAVRELKASAHRDIAVGGPELAAHAIRGGLVDEYHVFLAPIIVGGGTPSLPDDVRVELDLVDERRFASGFVYLHYQLTTRAT
jgi:dihydrofolate reductase